MKECVVLYTCYPNTQEAEEGGLGVWVQFWLFSENTDKIKIRLSVILHKACAVLIRRPIAITFQGTFLATFEWDHLWTLKTWLWHIYFEINFFIMCLVHEQIFLIIIPAT